MSSARPACRRPSAPSCRRPSRRCATTSWPRRPATEPRRYCPVAAKLSGAGLLGAGGKKKAEAEVWEPAGRYGAVAPADGLIITGLRSERQPQIDANYLGLWGGFYQTLKIPQRIWLGLVVLFGLAAGYWPRGRRGMVEVAALGGAVIIGLQCSISYWFYLYIVWFFPLVITALVLAHPPSPGYRDRPTVGATVEAHTPVLATGVVL